MEKFDNWQYLKLDVNRKHEGLYMHHLILRLTAFLFAFILGTFSMSLGEIKPYSIQNLQVDEPSYDTGVIACDSPELRYIEEQRAKKLLKRPKKMK
jgi:hypothetical protein